MIAAITLALIGITQTATTPVSDAANLPMVRVSVPVGHCRVTIDGQAHTLTGFANVLQTWRGSRRRLNLMPDPSASYRCVDRVLAILKTVDDLQLGFIGNDYVEPEKAK